MRLRYVIIGVIVLLIIGGLVFMIIKKEKRVEISNIKYLSFSYSKGYAVNSYIRYSLDCKKDGYIAEIKPYGIDDDEKITVSVSDDVVSKLVDVLKKYDVSSWNGFNKNNKNVLDGDSFSLYVRMDNDDTIEASGYMMWPKNYSDVRDSIDSIFMDIYDKEIEK